MRKSTRDSCKAQVTWFLTLAPTQSPSPPLAPCGMRGSEECFGSKAVTSGCHLEMNPTPHLPLLHPQSAGWLAGTWVDPPFFPFFPPLRLYTGSWSSRQIWCSFFIHILFVPRCGDFKQIWILRINLSTAKQWVTHTPSLAAFLLVE